MTEDRLQLLASTMSRARSRAFARYEPEEGEDSWSIGCTAYRRTCGALRSLAKDHPWFQTREEGLSFTILIDGEPVRFYCGEAEHPSRRSIRRGIEAAIAQGKLAFYREELESSVDGWCWLLAVETHADGSVARVVLLQANEQGEVRHEWPIALELPVAVVGAVPAGPREGIDLGPPQVGPRAPPMGRVVGDDRDGDDHR